MKKQFFNDAVSFHFIPREHLTFLWTFALHRDVNEELRTEKIRSTQDTPYLLRGGWTCRRNISSGFPSPFHTLEIHHKCNNDGNDCWPL